MFYSMTSTHCTALHSTSFLFFPSLNFTSFISFPFLLSSWLSWWSSAVRGSCRCCGRGHARKHITLSEVRYTIKLADWPADQGKMLDLDCWFLFWPVFFLFYSILFYSTILYSVLSYSILFSILFYSILSTLFWTLQCYYLSTDLLLLHLFYSHSCQFNYLVIYESILVSLSFVMSIIFNWTYLHIWMYSSDEKGLPKKSGFPFINHTTIRRRCSRCACTITLILILIITPN